MKNKFNWFKLNRNKVAVHITSFCASSLISLQAFSQESEPVKQVNGFPEWLRDPVFYLEALVTLLLLFTIYALYKANNSLMRIIDPAYFEEKEKTSKSLTTKIKKKSSNQK